MRNASGRSFASDGLSSVSFSVEADEVLSQSDRLQTPRNEEDQEYVEVTLDVHDDAIRVRSVTPVGEDPESRLLVEGWERKSSLRSASARIKAFSQELKAYSQELKNEIKKLSLNGNAAASRITDQISDQSGPSVPRRKPSKLHRSESAAQQALKRLRFITEATGNADLDKMWKAVENRFYELASPEGLLSRSDFAQCIGMKDSKEFAGELFDALARKRRRQVHSISKEELRDYWLELTDQSFDTRLQLFFEMLDTNADGRITEEEVKEVIMLSASANRLSRLKEQAEEYASLIMEDLDPDNLGYIEIWQLESLLLQGAERNGSMIPSQNLNFSQGLSQGLVPPPKRNVIMKCARKTKMFLDENWKRVWIIFLWMLAMAGLFTWKFIQYRERAAFQVMGYCVCAAKGAAETLKLNMSLILLPVCRNTITWLRNTKLGKVIPFDDNLNFHKVIALGIIGGVIIHAGVHLSCDFPRVINSSEEKFKLIQDDFDNKRPTYGDFLSGVEGITGIVMVTLMIIAFTLASRWFRRNLVKLPKPFRRVTGFNAFWYSHHLFVIVYICLIIHSIFLYLSHRWSDKTTWMYLSIPILLYLGERILRACRSGRQGVNILKVAIYPGNVLTLHMSKPQGFKYKSGQYIFVKCPDVSPFEWHPFSITSAPGDDYVSVHIRTLGDWTQELKRVFSEVCEPPLGGKSGLLRADYVANAHNLKLPRVLIDGPYGAPAQHYKQYDVMLLIGLGIGATPFISILKDMIHNMKLAEMEDPNQNLSNKSAETPRGRKKDSWDPIRAYFFWVTREQGSFDWFKGIMNEVAEYDPKGMIELHNYLTSVYEEGDARSALITMLQALNQAKHGVDILSGTRVRTHLGRPKWRKVFSRMAATHKGAKIGVFYCGAPVLAQELGSLVQVYNEKYSSSYGTRFEFHKENF